MLIRRERDAEFVNRIAESVRGNICYHDALMDWSYAVQRCVVLSNGEDAVMAFEEMSPRQFQGHTIFAPTCRGKRALDTARAMLAQLYPRWADRIYGQIPLKNRAARWFHRQIGLRSIGFVDVEPEGPVELFEMGVPA